MTYTCSYRLKTGALRHSCSIQTAARTLGLKFKPPSMPAVNSTSHVSKLQPENKTQNFLPSGRSCISSASGLKWGIYSSRLAHLPLMTLQRHTHRGGSAGARCGFIHLRSAPAVARNYEQNVRLHASRLPRVSQIPLFR